MKIKTIENEEIIVRCEDNKDVEIISKSTNRNYVFMNVKDLSIILDMYVVFDMTDES